MITPLKFEQNLDPDEMFELINTKLYEGLGRKPRIFESHLNYQMLVRALSYKPKILVLNCHGVKNYKSKEQETYFWFENEMCPSIVDDYSEQNLKKMFYSEVG
jgi:hypothetical protein